MHNFFTDRVRFCNWWSGDSNIIGRPIHGWRYRPITGTVRRAKANQWQSYM